MERQVAFWLECARDGSCWALVHVPESALGSLTCAWPIHPVAAERLAQGGILVLGEGFSTPPSETSTGFDLGHLAKDATRAVGHAVQHMADASNEAIEAVAHNAPGPIKAAARLVTRANLGDVAASHIVRAIGQGVKSGLKGADKAADTLLKGTVLAARAVDIPGIIAKHIPVPAIRGVMKTLDPVEHYANAVDMVRKGDIKGLRKMAVADLSITQSVISLVPGIGTGVSAALGAVEGVLASNTPLEIVLRMAYGAIPIPPGLRTVTDLVLNAVFALIEHKGHLTDAAIALARDYVPKGLPQDVFDTLIHVIAKREPILKAGADLAGHYVAQYTQGLAPALMQGVSKVAPGVAHALSQLPDPTQVYEHAKQADAPHEQVAEVAAHLAPILSVSLQSSTPATSPAAPAH